MGAESFPLIEGTITTKKMEKESLFSLGFVVFQRFRACLRLDALQLEREIANEREATDKLDHISLDPGHSQED